MRRPSVSRVLLLFLLAGCEAGDGEPDADAESEQEPDAASDADDAELEVPADADSESEGGACAGEPDETRTCGKCGTQTRACQDGLWSAWSECTDERGECVPGTTSSCGEESEALCLEGCYWGHCECIGPATQTCTCPEGSATQTRECLGDRWSDWSGCPCASPARHVDISCGEGANSGWYPTAVLDTINDKLLVVTANRARYSKPWLFRCEPDGTGCTSADLGGDSDSGTASSIAIDPTQRKLLVASQDDNISWTLPQSLPRGFCCNLDGTGCTQNLLSPMPYSGQYPSATFVDGVPGWLLIATTFAGDHDRVPLLLVCDRAASGCSAMDVSVGQGRDSGTFPFVLADTAGRKALVVTQNGANGNRPSLFRCDLDGTGCTHTDLSAGQGDGSGYSPGAVIDPTSNKLLVVTSNAQNQGRVSLFRCDLDGTGCTHADISAGHGGWNPRAVIDTVRGKLLVAMTNEANAVSVVRCELDGTDCAHIDMSADQGPQSGLSVAPVLDAASNRLLVVTCNGANDWKPGLFLLDL